VPGERIPALSEVLALAKTRPDLRLNIETKISPLVQDTVDHRTFTRKLVGALSGWEKRAGAVVRLADHPVHPAAEPGDLDGGAGVAVRPRGVPDTGRRVLAAGVVRRSVGAEPWTGGLDSWRFRDLGALTRAAGASTVSANRQVHDPARTAVAGPGW
jgi:glycerophosphoryl diester phosphodiesterase